MDLNERIPVIYLEQKKILNLLHKQDLIQDNKFRPKREGLQASITPSLFINHSIDQI